MKNIILFISILTLFACGGESPKSTSKGEIPTNKTSPSVTKNDGLASIEEVSNEVIAPKKNASEVQQELIEKAKMEKNATKVVEKAKDKANQISTKTAEKISEKTSNVVEKVKEQVPSISEVTEVSNAQAIETEKRKAQVAYEKKLADEAARKKMELEKKNTTQVKDFVDEKPPAPAPPAFSHSPFDALLKKHVSSTGKVNYKGLKNDESKLNAYLNQLEGTPIGKDWGKNKKMAYWINAYNAYTIKLILNNYPIASITKLHGGKPWDVKWIKLDGRTLSLNNIENDILRPTYKDARIHFAVNCAAKSCPPLLNQAWTADNLNSNFEKQAKAFINNSKYNSISGDNAAVSKIFEWYAEDFGDLKNYLNKYASSKIAPSTQIKYKEYDWTLNE